MSPWLLLGVFTAGLLLGAALLFLVAVVWGLERDTVDGEADPYQSRPRSG